MLSRYLCIRKQCGVAELADALAYLASKIRGSNPFSTAKSQGFALGFFAFTSCPARTPLAARVGTGGNHAR